MDSERKRGMLRRKEDNERRRGKERPQWIGLDRSHRKEREREMERKNVGRTRRGWRIVCVHLIHFTSHIQCMMGGTWHNGLHHTKSLITEWLCLKPCKKQTLTKQIIDRFLKCTENKMCSQSYYSNEIGIVVQETGKQVWNTTYLFITQINQHAMQLTSLFWQPSKKSLSIYIYNLNTTWNTNKALSINSFLIK